MKKIIIPIFLLLALAGGYWYYKKSQTKAPVSNISSYRNTNIGISFKYPKNLSVKGDNVSIVINHQVPFEHHDFCDFKGEATTTINTLTDFNVTMHITDQSLIDTMKSESPYIPEENFLNGEIVTSPGFIDAVTIGSFSGYGIFEGAEGCGHTVYYLKISDSRTLVVINDLITIFSGAIDVDKMNQALMVPGVINKATATETFDSIMKSLSVQ